MSFSFDVSIFLAFYGAFAGIFAMLWVAKNVLFTIRFS